MEKLDMKTTEITEENIDKLAAIFPHCITEVKEENGTITRGVDFNLLKQEFSNSVVDGPRESYSINWPGKKASIVSANTPINKTLRPCRKESVDFDTTENLYIEGDNLEVLKLLQENYIGKIKMIYIDPPYNTGKDFVYKDNFTRSKEEELEDSGQVDITGGKLVSNQETNGRYHSDWLSMIYPRLKKAKYLLKDDGVIFISIDDNEVHNLRKICDEVFGEDNFVAQYIHKNNSSKNQATLVSVSTEYFFCYAKNKEILKKEQWRLKKKGAQDIAKLFNSLNAKQKTLDEIELEIKEMYKRPKYAHLSRWNKVDSRGVFVDADLSREGGAKNYTITNPNTNTPCLIPNRGWGKSKEELIRLQKEDLIWYGSNETPPRMKEYIDPNDVSVPDSFWYYDNSVDTRWIKNEFGELIFENPKPLDMLKNMIEMVNLENGDIVMDFFAGSGTTAHAVLSLNAEDNVKRRFILIQIAEDLDESLRKSTGTAKKTLQNAISYLETKRKPHNLTEISKERIRRASKIILDENADKDEIKDLDIGFRVLKIDSSNMKDVYYTPDQMNQSLLDSQESNVKEDRTDEDLLFQILLDWGINLTLPIKRESINNKEVYFVDEDTLAACFEDDINEEFVKELAKRKAMRVVFKESGFKSDEMKINIDQIFTQLSPDTEVRGI